MALTVGSMYEYHKRVHGMAESSLISCPERKPLGRADNIEMAVKSLFLCPIFFVLAWIRGCPGLDVHLRTVLLGVKLLLKAPSKNHARWIYYPVESTRYFELSFALKNVDGVDSWLDVSSPRIFSGIFLSRSRSVKATLLNPDVQDLEETGGMLAALGLEASLAAHTVQEFAPGTQFDLVSTISVLEHIWEDEEALRRMWALVRPGGKLVITLPVHPQGGKQYMEKDPYNLVKDKGEPCFFQRFYTRQGLDSLERIVGKPFATEIWGEKVPGWLQANFAQKRSNPKYPVWREPLLMAQNWLRYKDVETLPGEGVFCAVYKKMSQ